ncbi:MAG: TonB-dependent receptor [Saprospiraceae bacterium]|nr:TonB-dependent receptor [Saprospiraceae bacterium]
MRKAFYSLLFSALTTFAFAQNVTGVVLDAETGESLIGASVTVEGTSMGTTTDFNGRFTIKEVSNGDYTLVITYTGYETTEMNVTVAGNNVDLGTVKVGSDVIGLEQINVVASIAIDRRTPVAVSTVKGQEIESKLGNQEFVEALKSTPSIYTTKTGGGFGDSRINVRGFAQEDIALLINGIPVNGMEDNKVYWSNWAGLGDVTRTIQIQRGLGASKLAVASVGGTINIITKTTDQEQGGSISQSIGNNNYRKTSFTVSTGRTENDWAFTFSGSRTTGDGYIAGTYIDAWSYFMSIAKEWGGNQQLMFTAFGAPQRHGQRDFVHSLNTLKNVYGIKYNDDIGPYRGETYNWRENFYHKPQASLTYINDLNAKTSWVTSLYGSVGRGGGTGDLGGLNGRRNEFRQPKDSYGEHQWDQYELYNSGQENTLYDNSLAPLTYSIDGGAERTGQIASLNDGLIKRASINEHNWYGVLSTVNHQITDNLNFNGGVDVRFYNGRHYRKSINLLGADYWFDRDNINNTADWVDFNGDGVRDANELGNLVKPTNDANNTLFGSVENDQKIDYANDEDINWYGAFGQLEYVMDNGLSVFVSGALNYTQMRRYDYFLKPEGDQVTDWFSFLGGNVKGGANYNFDGKNNVFFNAGYISRAPYFDALFPTFNNDEANTDAVNEGVTSFEVGYGHRSRMLRANINGYYTSWTNKTTVSSYDDANNQNYFLNLLGVDATHMGVELDFEVALTSNFNVKGFASINNWEWANDPNGVVTDDMNNVIGESTFFLNGLKVGDAAQTTMGLGANWDLGAGVSLDAQANYYENLYASYQPGDRDDETLKGVQALRLPHFTLVDMGMTWKFKVMNMDSRIRVNVNNIFDTLYVAEANDNPDPDQPNINDDRGSAAYDALLYGTNGWFGFGRTWNATLKVNF